MINPAPLETARLILRPPVEADAEAIYRGWATDVEVTRYLVWLPHKRLDDTRAFLRFVAEGWASGREFSWLICRKPGLMPVGSIALRPDGAEAEIGYALARAQWGQGLMTEAATAVVARAFADPAIERVGALCDVDNAASARVMEKIGMTRQGLRPGVLRHPAFGDILRDAYSYAVTRAEWQAGASKRSRGGISGRSP